jgi:hypothetical protein
MRLLTAMQPTGMMPLTLSMRARPPPDVQK